VKGSETAQRAGTPLLRLLFETYAASLDNKAGLASGWFDGPRLRRIMAMVEVDFELDGVQARLADCAHGLDARPRSERPDRDRQHRVIGKGAAPT
jgi:hypothetical protein